MKVALCERGIPLRIVHAVLDRVLAKQSLIEILIVPKLRLPVFLFVFILSINRQCAFQIR